MNNEFLGFLVALITAIIPLTTFLLSKTVEQRQINFDRFHNTLLKGLANQNQTTGLDQQVAILFELRNYPDYYLVINRLLEYQIGRWSKEIKNNPHYSILVREAKETKKFINMNIFARFLVKINNKLNLITIASEV